MVTLWMASLFVFAACHDDDDDDDKGYTPERVSWLLLRRSSRMPWP